MSPLSDGTAIAVNDSLIIGSASGKFATNYGLGGGERFSAIVPSTVLTNTAVATKYDQNYTFPANSIRAGDTIRLDGEISIPSGNSTNTLLTEIMLGTQVIATLTAFDPTDGGGDIIAFECDITIRTAGASGTMVAWGKFTKNVNGTTTSAEFQLPVGGVGTTAIDTTVAQQAAIRGTWSVANAANQSRLDTFNIKSLNTNGIGLTAGTCRVAAAGGSPVLFRANVNCQW